MVIQDTEAIRDATLINSKKKAFVGGEQLHHNIHRKGGVKGLGERTASSFLTG
jgi:hypothetical protein